MTMGAGIAVRHSDGRLGHVFNVNVIESDKRYYFRYQTAEGHGFIGESDVSGKKLTGCLVDDSYIQFALQNRKPQLTLF